MELLPTIANYFGVSIDKLLSNDVDSKEAELTRFYETLNTLEFGSLEQLQFIEEYYHKYPDNNRIAFILQDIMKNHVLVNRDKRDIYLPTMIKLYERLQGTSFYEGAVNNIICVCPEEDLGQWLELCPWSSEYTSRGCLVSRYIVQGDMKNCHLQQCIEAFENFAVQLDRRYPDEFGPEGKAEFHRSLLQIIASFGDGMTPPDGWAIFYAYKQFVLAACLFGAGKTEEGWKEFDDAFATYRRIFALEDEWLPLGNAVFSDLKIRKDYTKVQDAEGNEHDVYYSHYVHFCSAKFVHEFLTDLRWAWFDGVRNTERYQAAVEWVKVEAKKEARK